MPLKFQALHVRFKLTGDAFFDPAFFALPKDQIYVPANVPSGNNTISQSLFLLDPTRKILDWFIPCIPNFQHQFNISNSTFPNRTIFNAGIIKDAYDPNDTNDNISIEVVLAKFTGLTTGGPSLSCSNTCCDFPVSVTTSALSQTLDCIGLPITGNITSFQTPSAPANPEELTYSINLNNTGSTYNYDELDFRIRVTDECLTLSDIGLLPMDSPNSPIFSYENQHESTGSSGEVSSFYYKYGPGTLQNGTTTIAMINILDPVQFENLLGKGKITIEFVRVKPSGGMSCCKLMPKTIVPFEFAGIKPCTPGTRKLLVGPLQSSPSGPCKTGFSLKFNNFQSTGLNLEELYIELDVQTYGVMDFSQIIVSNPSMTCAAVQPSSPCPSGCAEICNSNKIKISFSDAMNPMTVGNNDYFDFIFDGNNGGISAVNVVGMGLKEVNQQSGCLPEIGFNPNLSFPIEKCDYCSVGNADILQYSGTATINTGCESGFSLWAHLGTQQVDRITLEFSLGLMGVTPVTINATKSASFCDALANASCDLGTGASNCMELNGNTVTLDYCGGNVLTGDVKLLDLVLNGLGTVSGVNFTKFEIHPVNGQTCDFLYLGGNNIFPLTPTGPTCPEWQVLGTILYTKLPNTTLGVGHADICVSSQTFTPTSTPVCTNPIATTSTGSDCTNGSYSVSFNTNQNGINFITPIKDCNSTNGVTTFDVVTIRKHILYNAPLSSDYFKIAADANNNGSITTFDLILITKVLLGNLPDFPDNSSWRFVPADYVFTYPPGDPAYVFPNAFPEYAAIQYSSVPISKNFIGIKVGDVNGSATCEDMGCNNPFSPNDFPSDRSKPISLNFNELILKESESGWIEFSLESLEELAAWQVGLFFDPNSILVDEIKVLSRLGDFNLHDNFGLTEIKDGKIKFLWVSPNGQSFSFKNRPIFKMHVKALHNIANIWDLIEIKNEVLLSVGYDSAGEPYSISKNVNKTANSISDAIFSNLNWSITATPNPFSDKVIFDIKSPENSHDFCSLIVYNAMGVEVAKWTGWVDNGVSESTFKATESWGTGVFRYILKTPSQTISGNLVKI